MGPSSLGDNQTEKFVPPAEETALRQTRWQKVIYPNKITGNYRSASSRIPSGYLGPIQHPERPVGRVWECNRWMPFNWANTSEYDLNPSGFTGRSSCTVPI